MHSLTFAFFASPYKGSLLPEHSIFFLLSNKWWSHIFQILIFCRNLLPATFVNVSYELWTYGL